MKVQCYPFTRERQSCSGCGACAQACSYNALSMQADEEGFLYPTLDPSKCVQCGLCSLICPMINERHQENTYKEATAYLATTNDKKFSIHSATIGICTWLSQTYVHSQGKAFGVILDETEWKAKHVCADNLELVEKMRNSKSLQSDTGDTYSKVKSLLRIEEQVLYIGTPCQIAGLKAFLRKPYDNLLTIDLICHGVFSPILIPLEVKYWETLLDGKLSSLRFRSKRFYPWNMGGVVNFDLTKTDGKKKHIERHATSSPTYRCFAYTGDSNSYNLRPSCYNCPFRGKGRYGDLTVGDAWGMSAKYKSVFNFTNTRNGISLMLCNTEKGREIAKLMQRQFNILEIPRYDAFVQPALMKAHREIPDKRNKLYKSLDSPYGKFVEDLMHVNLQKEAKKAVWTYVKRRCKFVIKRLMFSNKF